MSDPAGEAALDQVASGYGVDFWTNITLSPMMKLWQGVGGHSNFFLSEEDARESMGSYKGTTAFQFAETLWRFAQVEPNVKHGFRQGIQEFVVDMNTKAAMGVCINNPKLGSGSVLQYYIPNWERTVFATGRRFDFASKGY